jgi:chemotaxis protein CheD
MTGLLLKERSEAQVGMGQIAVVTGEQFARSVLGSCIGVAVYDARRAIGAMAHVVLPQSSGRAASPGKFADTAVSWMVDELAKLGADARKLTAKIAGGANMFNADGPFQIGKQNAEAVRAQLSALGIRLAAEHLGGVHGRKVTFWPKCGTYEIEAVGHAVVKI